MNGSIPPAFAALFAPNTASGNMQGVQAKTPSPTDAAAFVAAVNYLQSMLAEGQTLPNLLRARANELYNLAELVEAAEKMTDKEEVDEDKPDDKVAEGDKPKE